MNVPTVTVNNFSTTEDDDIETGGKRKTTPACLFIFPFSVKCLKSARE